jgi:uncharacterized iron-regulated membrane protein
MTFSENWCRLGARRSRLTPRPVKVARTLWFRIFSGTVAFAVLAVFVSFTTTTSKLFTLTKLIDLAASACAYYRAQRLSHHGDPPQIKSYCEKDVCQFCMHFASSIHAVLCVSSRYSIS